MSKPNFRQIKAIESANKKRLKELNSGLEDKSGIYILWRTEVHGYVGQSVHCLQRLAEHMVGFQHIDLSLKRYGLFSDKNKHGYKVGFLPCDKGDLDEKEREYIQKCIDEGWILKNKTSGGQDEGKEKIADFRPSKTYRDGLKQGRKQLARELSHIIEKHLEIGFKDGKEHNKISIGAREKFFALIDENNYKEGNNND